MRLLPASRRDARKSFQLTSDDYVRTICRRFARRPVGTLESSTPHVPLVIFDSMALQNRPKLFLECRPSVMLRLIVNVFDRVIHLRDANRKRAVPFLPIHVLMPGKRLMHPR